MNRKIWVKTSEKKVTRTHITHTRMEIINFNISKRFQRDFLIFAD